MKEQILDEVVARRFWLGQLSPEEQGRIEELAFNDPQTFEFLQAAEDDLIDEFVYDDLSPAERARFQDHFLAQPGRREDLRIARALQGYFEREQPVPSFWERLRKWFHLTAPPLIPALVAAAIIIGAIIWLMPRIRDLFQQRYSPPQQAQQQQTPVLPTPTSTASETPLQASPSPEHKDNQNKPPLSPHRPTSPVYAIVLAPGGPVRSGGEETPVSLSSGPAYFELPLIGNTSYRTYQATLESDGQTIQTWPNLKATKISSGNGIRVRVPFDQLKVSQRYRIVLKGITANHTLQPVDEYYFRATN